MSTRYWLGIAFAVLLLLSSFLSVSASPPGQQALQTIPPPPFDVIRVDVASDGTPGNGTSNTPSISGDGRFVAFTSESTNLVPDDTNGVTDVFMHDTQTGVTTRVSVNIDGQQANAGSVSPSISGDGRFVVFSSRATNLVLGVSNGHTHIFLYDSQTGIISCVSVTSEGEEGNRDSYGASISGDGRFVAFMSGSTNLVPDDTNGVTDVFMHDTQTGVTTRVSVNVDGQQANASSSSGSPPGISGDGRFVVFSSEATNLVTDDTNGAPDIFVHDIQTGITNRVSIASDGSQANSWNYNPSISADGRYVAFSSIATNLVLSDTNNVADIFVHDSQTGITSRISDSFEKTLIDGHSLHPIISADGTYVAFMSSATNIVPNDSNGVSDIFIYNTQSNKVGRVSIMPSGTQRNSRSTGQKISADGHYVVYMNADIVTGNAQIYIMNFKKASLDIYPPSSSLDTLPYLSNSHSISLAWNGADSLSPLGTVGTIDHFDVQVRVGESGVWQDVITATQVTSYTYSAQTDGLHQFRVRAVDDAGNVEGWPESYDTHTVVDQTSPTGAIAINYNPNSGIAAEFTTSRNVSLWLSANDDTSGVTDFRLSTDGITYGLWQPIAEQTTTVLDGLSGLQLVAAQFRDRVGNQSTTYTDTIILASQLGTDYGLSINNGDLFTNQAAVTLTIAAAPYTAEMQVSNDGGFQNSPWQPYSLSKPWQITAFGSFQMPRIVYARFRNTDGSTSAIYQDDIILDPNAPKSNVTELVLGRLGRNSFPLTVRWVGEDDISGVKWYDIQVQLDSGEWQNWLTSTTAQESSYSVMPGHRYAFRTRAQDYAGNWESYRNTEMSIAIPITTELRQYLPSIHR